MYPAHNTEMLPNGGAQSKRSTLLLNQPKTRSNPKWVVIAHNPIEMAIKMAVLVKTIVDMIVASNVRQG